MARSNTTGGGTILLEDPADDLDRPVRRETPARPLRSSRPGPAPPPGDDEDEPFLRARRRVPVRRSLIPAWARGWWGVPVLGAALLFLFGAALALLIAVRSFSNHDPRFRIDSSASIKTLGNSQLSRAELLSVFGSDIGRNLFFVPLEKRRLELEQIPWVERATVMRMFPNQLRVAITERIPIAFVDAHGHIALADANGVILNLTPRQMAARHYSFPVVSGINPADPLTVRAARMQVFERFIGELDSTGEHVSAQLSEVDLSDPDDVRATVPANGSDLLLHFGDENFLPRWHNYQAHVAQWQQQYPKLAAIDLRYDREVVLKMAGEDAPAKTAPAKTAPPAAPPPKTSASLASPSHALAPQHATRPHKPLVAKHTPAPKASPPHIVPQKTHSTSHQNRGTE